MPRDFGVFVSCLVVAIATTSYCGGAEHIPVVIFVSSHGREIFGIPKRVPSLYLRAMSEIFCLNCYFFKRSDSYQITRVSVGSCYWCKNVCRVSFITDFTQNLREVALKTKIFTAVCC